VTASPASFRLALLNDAATIALYHQRCWETAFADLVNPGDPTKVSTLGQVDRWRSWLAPDSGFTTIVADVDGLFVDPDHWERGLGRSLLTIGEQMLADNGHSTIELHTMVGNTPALGLYESAGWVVTDRIIHTNEDVVYDEHVLVKQLG
jgi:ribosomal protein S18 acetylase RimI-like enzyme